MSFTYLGIQITSNQDPESDVIHHKQLKLTEYSGCFDIETLSNLFVGTGVMDLYKNLIFSFLYMLLTNKISNG